MLIFGSPIIDWSAIGKIVIVALIGGSGVVIVYGFLLLGLKYAGVGDARLNPQRKLKSRSATPSPPVCAILVVGVIVLGIYAMTQKS